MIAGIDAAPRLLHIARQRVPGGGFRIGDLENLPFPDNPFGVVTGFNAHRFAANPVRALAQARRLTGPGGIVTVMTWGRPEGKEATSAAAALRPLLPSTRPCPAPAPALCPLLPAPPPGAPGPVALSDPDRLTAFTAEAGLAPREVIEGETQRTCPDAATAPRST